MTLDYQSQLARETWYALREFETRDITARSYQKRHSLDLPAEKAREITSNFIQAREYFRSATTADFSVRPLLQYYGVATLSRGITLFLRPDRRECALSPKHGLVSLMWQQTLSGGLADIGKLRIQLTKGTFHDLLEATANKFYFRSDSRAVNLSLGGLIPKRSSEFTLQEIAARIPDLSDQYSVWKEESVEFTKLVAFHIDDTSHVYRFSIPVFAESRIHALFPPELFPNLEVIRQENALVVESAPRRAPFLAQKTGAFDFLGDAVVLCEFPDSRLYFSPLAAGYMASYVLGMLCRYFPTTWISIARSDKGDAVYPLVTRLLDWIQDRYPSMIVDILRGPYNFETS